MPSLVESIKQRGLVLVADTSDEVGERRQQHSALTPGRIISVATEWAFKMPEGVNGVLRGTGVLRFNDTIDM